MSYIARFITPGNIIEEYRRKKLGESRKYGTRARIGNARLEPSEVVEAFLNKFDDLGNDGWIFRGMVQYPDLPYGGVYVFYKSKDENFDTAQEPNDSELLNIDTYSRDEREDIGKMISSMYEVDDSEITKNREVAEKRDSIEKKIVDEKNKEIEKKLSERREMLYEQFEDENPGKNAVYHGNETKQFKKWLDERE